eukprot:TRINITY_DN13976_c0_g1_i1.p1 TRINITY_DN13976_c0_g1~~TRINITY_DN13976_c0_g1_i1.p1  ORF type:complete len:605 (+),score=117.15 TRINITY_DN13976_c0_g1_i1:80-1894(+)
MTETAPQRRRRTRDQGYAETDGGAAKAAAGKPGARQAQVKAQAQVSDVVEAKSANTAPVPKQQSGQTKVHADPRVEAQRLRNAHLGLDSPSEKLPSSDEAVKRLCEVIPTLSAEAALARLLKHDMDVQQAYESLVGDEVGDNKASWSSVVSRRDKFQAKLQQQQAERALRCHLCSEPGHKQVNCPKRSILQPRRKQESASAQQAMVAAAVHPKRPTKSKKSHTSAAAAPAEVIAASQPPPSSALDLLEPSTDLRCPQCRQLFADPRLLDCLHSVCAGCLPRLVQANTPGYMICPICASPSQVHQDGFPSVAANLALATAVESEKGAHRNCENCEGAASTAFCYECAAFMCGPCSETVHSNRVHRAHRVVAASEKKKQPRTCQDHQGERLGLFCMQCRVVVCSHCLLVGSHRGHNCASLKDVSNDVRERIQDKVHDTEEKQKRLITQYESMENMLSNIDTTYSESCNAIKRRFEELRTCLDQRMNSLLGLALRVRDNKLAALHRAQDELRVFISQVKEGWECAEKLAQISDDSELMELHSAIDRRLSVVMSLGAQVPHGATEGVGTILDNSLDVAVQKYGAVLDKEPLRAVRQFAHDPAVFASYQ